MKYKQKLPESMTALAKHLLCLETYPIAHAAASFTPRLKSPKHSVIASIPPSDTIDIAISGECFAKARTRNSVAFLKNSYNNLYALLDDLRMMIYCNPYILLINFLE